MALLVQKYGGSSVADAEKIANVARRIGESAAGNQLVVVVSAMGKTTDGLVHLAQQITPSPDPREMDMLLASGEQVTITRIDASRVRQALDAGEIAVVAGFQGLSESDEIATLGRGGSDLTGVALAA